MITEVSRDIFTLDVEALVNPVNCVGVSGKGLAMAFKRRFEMNQLLYEKHCNLGLIRLGEVAVSWDQSSQKHIFNFPTKQHWRDASELSSITSGLTMLVKGMMTLSVGSIAIPALGCGEGGLRWEDVRRELYTGLESVEADVYLIPPRGMGFQNS